MERQVIGITNQLELPLDFDPVVIRKIRRDLNRLNPAWEEAVEAGRSTKGIQARIRLLNQNKTHFTLPRGYLYKLKEYMDCKVREQWSHPLVNFHTDQTDFTFTGKLKPNQRVAEREILKNMFCVIQRPTGGGKTVIALKVIAERKVPTLIVVHTERLLKQWKKKAEEFLGIPEEEIGQIGEGEYRLGEKITVAIVNSLYTLLAVQWAEINYKIGFLIVDECHRVPAKAFGSAIINFSCPYMLGLSATVFRSDKLDEFIHYYLGEKVHEVAIKKLQEAGDIMTPELKLIKTNFYFHIRSPRDYQRMVKKLVEDENRNELLARRIARQVKNNRGWALVLSNFKKHCRIMQAAMQELGQEPLVMIGDVKSSERDDITEQIMSKERGTVIATGQIIGEGSDFPSLTSLWIIAPIKFEGRVEQYVGRVLRIEEGKDKAVIFDCDDSPWLLQHSLKSRLGVYEKCGATL